MFDLYTFIKMINERVKKENTRTRTDITTFPHLTKLNCACKYVHVHTHAATKSIRLKSTLILEYCNWNKY